MKNKIETGGFIIIFVGLATAYLGHFIGLIIILLGLVPIIITDWCFGQQTLAEISLRNKIINKLRKRKNAKKYF